MVSSCLLVYSIQRFSISLERTQNSDKEIKAAFDYYKEDKTSEPFDSFIVHEGLCGQKKLTTKMYMVKESKNFGRSYLISVKLHDLFQIYFVCFSYYKRVHEDKKHQDVRIFTEVREDFLILCLFYFLIWSHCLNGIWYSKVFLCRRVSVSIMNNTNVTDILRTQKITASFCLHDCLT